MRIIRRRVYDAAMVAVCWLPSWQDSALAGRPATQEEVLAVAVLFFVR